MCNPIRVLCVFSTLNRGGAESMCMNLYRHIDRTKVQFDFVKHYPEKGAFEDEILRLGGKIYEAPSFRVYNYYHYKKWWKQHLLQHPEHKVIHGHYFSISAIYFRVAKRYNRITIAHSHCTMNEQAGIKGAVKLFLESRIGQYADYCFACSKEAGEWLFKDKNYIQLNNAIELQNYAFNASARMKIRQELGIDAQTKVVVHVGRFQRQKNHMFLVDVIKEIQKNTKIVFVMVGDGELHKEVEKRVKNLGLQNKVIFTGVRTDISDILQGADLFVLPSLFEGLPVVAIEAQASGLPCFLSDRITKEANVSGICEFLPINNPQIWAERIQSVKVARKVTTVKMHEMGYDIRSTSSWLQDFYLDLISRAM